jgi:hypothetical protein
MVRDLHFPVRIIAHETVRESNGVPQNPKTPKPQNPKTPKKYLIGFVNVIFSS